MMGQKRGRLCMLYQVDFDEHTLLYSGDSRSGKISGEIKSEQEFTQGIDELLSIYATDRLEVALKRISLKDSRISGVCPKSFPKTPFTSELLGLLNICLGGSNGTDLIHLPFEGRIIDQPNIFIEAYFIYVSEYSRWIKPKTTQPVKKNEDSR